MTDPALPPPTPTPKEDALRLVETAFLASTAALMWLVSAYLNPVLPFLLQAIRLFFPLPVAVALLRWNVRAGQMCLTASTLLLAVLLGPVRSLLYLMPYGVLGLLLGRLWQTGRSWYLSVVLGTLVSGLGLVFQLLVSSVLVGENLWLVVTFQLTGVVNWMLDFSLGWLGIHLAATPALLRLAIIGLVAFDSIIYVFTLHLVAALVVEKLGRSISPPPKWVMALLSA